MSSERRDVNRLFRHFGLDSSGYVQFSSRSAAPVSEPPAAQAEAHDARDRSDATVPRYLARR